jgi:hypothetical protein
VHLRDDVRAADRAEAVAAADPEGAVGVDPDRGDGGREDGALAERPARAAAHAVGGGAADERDERARDVVGAADELAAEPADAVGEEQERRVPAVLAGAQARGVGGGAGGVDGIGRVPGAVRDAERQAVAG